MKSRSVHYSTKKTSLFFVFINLAYISFSQTGNTIEKTSHFGGAVTVTNNGISFIPNFTLGKPAAIFDMSVGKGNLSFEPQFRFALEGKPWSIIFWWRYRLLKTDRIQISIGAHPALSFKSMMLSKDSLTKEYMTVQRYVAGELAPNYFITDRISLGLYYFYGHGIDKDAVKSTHMLALRTNFSNIRLSNQYFIRLNPQVYYLRMEDKDGYYFSASLGLARKNFPLSVSALVNNPFKTNITSGDKFVWNVSLIYAFNRGYVKK